MNNCILICLLSFLLATFSFQRPDEKPAPNSNDISKEFKNQYFESSFISLYYIETQMDGQLQLNEDSYNVDSLFSVT